MKKTVATKPSFILCSIVFSYFTINGVKGYDDSEPCDYWDTLNITGKYTSNDTHYFIKEINNKTIIVQEHDVKFYDYSMPDGKERPRQTEERHRRACICKSKPCIRFCENKDLNEYLHYVNNLDYVNITDEHNNTEEVSVQNHFNFLIGFPYYKHDMYYLNQSLSKDKWILLENGSIFRNGSILLDRNAICFGPFRDELVAFVRSSQRIEIKLARIIGYGLSAIGFFLTILGHLAIKKLRNLYGRCVCCYLLSMLITFLHLTYFAANGGMPFTERHCVYMGYIFYFAAISSFLWLSVISYDCWCTIRPAMRSLVSNRFLYYSIYSWGLAVFLTILISILKNSNMHEELKSGIKMGQLCWLDNTRMKYFNGIVLIVMIFNTVMFVMTTLNIRKVQKSVTIFSGREGQRHFQKNSNNFNVFLTLFLVMGIPWTMDFIGWAWPNDFTEYLTYLNALNGLIVFICFLTRQEVRKSLKRWNTMNTSTSSTTLKSIRKFKKSSEKSENESF